MIKVKEANNISYLKSTANRCVRISTGLNYTKEVK